MPRQEQVTQVRNSRAYNDALAAGVALEATPGDLDLQNDLNALRSILRLHNRAAGKWYDAVLDSFDLRAIHDKMFAFQMPMMPGTMDFVLGAPASGKLIPASAFPGGAGIVAVGPASVANLGYIVAAEANFTLAGTLGVGLSTALDAESVLLNRVAILDAATDDNPETAAGEHIFGLLQTVAGTADGAVILGAGSENVQISFVFYAVATGVLTATTLPAATYHFAPVRQRNLYSLTRGFTLAGGSLPEILDPAGAVSKTPFREIDITAGAAIVANDPMTITTGTFVGAGARGTVASSFGTPGLPTTGAAFRDDSRIKVWLNGQLLSKGESGVPNRDVYWVSTTQVAFEFVIFSTDTLLIESPAAF